MIQFFHSLLSILYHPFNRKQPFKTLCRVGWWKMNQWWWQWPAVVDITPNMKCICYPDSSFGSLVVYTKWPEYSEMKFVFDTLSARSVFIDIGAGLGEFTLVAAAKITKGMIIACEPLAEVRKQLEENIRLNNLESMVKVDSRVVSDANGQVVFQRANTTEQSGIAGHKNNHFKRISLPAVKLDSIVSQHHLKTIDLVKIDTEGAELKILRGAVQTLKTNKVKHWIIELNPLSVESFGTTPWDCIALLHQHGYTTYRWHRNRWTRINQPTDLPTETINILATKKKM